MKPRDNENGNLYQYYINKYQLFLNGELNFHMKWSEKNKITLFVKLHAVELISSIYIVVFR